MTKTSGSALASTDAAAGTAPVAGHHRSMTRELVELAGLFVAAGAADLFADVLSLDKSGPYLLFGLGFLALTAIVVTRWWRHRTPAAPKPLDGLAELNDTPTQLWRVRATVRDTPGRLGALASSLAAYRINIVSVQVHAVPDGAVDEFLVQAPVGTTAGDITAAIERGGGLDVRAEHADMHELIDVPTRVLLVAAEAVSTGPELPKALRTLLGDCEIRWEPTPPSATGPDVDGADVAGADIDEGAQGNTLRLTDPAGGVLVLERPSFPFTPAEFARARALLELDRRLADRLVTERDVVDMPDGTKVAIRPGGRADAARVLAMHERCGAESRRRRYLGAEPPKAPTLARLLNRRHGHAMVVESPTGDVVALGNLMWDGDVAEVAVLVQDDWQGRGLGGELLRRLVDLARESGTESVYAVCHAGNRPLIRAMRTLGAEITEISEGTAWLTLPLPAHANRS